jgi:aminoglycoside phosphotransferase (APT) family kinase protein
MHRRCLAHSRHVVNVGVDGRAGIDAALVRRLVAAQFPQWRDLPVTPVEVDGWDNRTYRLGDHMAVRLPTNETYAPAVDKEHRWLPILAPLLPVPIPAPLAKGAPGEGYPFKWSIRRWLDGETARRDRVGDLSGLATSVAEFILALQRIDAAGGPQAGGHSFYRGAAPAYYHDQTRRCLAVLEGRIDTARASAVWDAALAAAWDGPPVWFHGDMASGNLLVRQGRLAAVIDFGTSGVGDPACDLVIAWTLFSGDSREAFRRSVGQDAAIWARARGWALWKALLGLAADIDTDEQAAAVNRQVIDDVLADHEAAAG